MATNRELHKYQVVQHIRGRAGHLCFACKLWRRPMWAEPGAAPESRGKHQELRRGFMYSNSLNWLLNGEEMFYYFRYLMTVAKRWGKGRKGKYSSAVILSQSPHITTPVKKAQKRLDFLRKLKKAQFQRQILGNFYRGGWKHHTLAWVLHGPGQDRWLKQLITSLVTICRKKTSANTYQEIRKRYRSIRCHCSETPRLILPAPLYKIICFYFVLLCSIKTKLSSILQPQCCKNAYKLTFTFSLSRVTTTLWKCYTKVQFKCQLHY